MKNISKVNNNAGSVSDEDMEGDPVTVPQEESENSLTSDQSVEEPPQKKSKVRGMNKNRPRHLARTDPSKKLCPAIIRETECSYGDRCKFIHDIAKYMALKLPDIGNVCVNYEKFGKCPYGVTCRYGKSHITEDFKNCVNEKHAGVIGPRTVNTLSKDLQTKLRKKKYNFSKADEYLKHLDDVVNNAKPISELCKVPQNGSIKTVGALTDEDTVRLLPDEKTKVCFKNLWVQN